MSFCLPFGFFGCCLPFPLQIHRFNRFGGVYFDEKNQNTLKWNQFPFNSCVELIQEKILLKMIKTMTRDELSRFALEAIKKKDEVLFKSILALVSQIEQPKCLSADFSYAGIISCNDQRKLQWEFKNLQLPIELFSKHNSHGVVSFKMMSPMDPKSVKKILAQLLKLVPANKFQIYKVNISITAADDPKLVLLEKYTPKICSIITTEECHPLSNQILRHCSSLRCLFGKYTIDELHLFAGNKLELYLLNMKLLDIFEFITGVILGKHNSLNELMVETYVPPRFELEALLKKIFKFGEMPCELFYNNNATGWHVVTSGDMFKQYIWIKRGEITEDGAKQRNL